MCFVDLEKDFCRIPRSVGLGKRMKGITQVLASL